MVRIPGFSRKPKGLESESEEEVRVHIKTLENENKFLEDQIESLKKQRNSKFEEGLNSSDTHREQLASQILELDKQIGTKNGNIKENLQMISSLSDVANAKSQDSGTASNDVYRVIDETDRGKLMERMTKSAYSKERRRQKISDFSKVTGISAPETSIEPNKDVSEIMGQWKKLEEGSTTLTPENSNTTKNEEKGTSEKEQEDSESESV